MMITDLRKLGQLDGTVARILNKRAQILEEDPTRGAAEDAQELRLRANVALRDILALRRGPDDEAGDEPNVRDLYTEDRQFDKVVPLFFR